MMVVNFPYNTRAQKTCISGFWKNCTKTESIPVIKRKRLKTKRELRNNYYKCCQLPTNVWPDSSSKKYLKLLMRTVSLFCCCFDIKHIHYVYSRWQWFRVTKYESRYVDVFSVIVDFYFYEWCYVDNWEIC